MSIKLEERPSSKTAAYTFTTSEKFEIERHVDTELNRFQQKMVYMGGAVNTLLAIFFVFTGLISDVKPVYLALWFAAILACNVINTLFTYQNRHVILSQIRSAQRSYHLTVGLLALTWGCVGIFSSLGNPQFHLYVITYLQIALVGFCFGTVTDFTACIICAICILLPYFTLRIYSGARSLLTTGHDPNLNITYIISLSIITMFLLAASYIGYRLIKRFFRLSFEKISLSQKLEEANEFLEERVKERTIELEDSLKLVTYQSTHDSLTDLPNHRLLLEHVDEAIEKANSTNNSFGIVYLSLNEIKKINEAMGQDAEEVIIKTIAERFKKKFNHLSIENGEKSHFLVTLSRKDIFVILLDPIVNPKEIDKTTQTIFAILKDPVNVEKQSVKLTASVGVSIYPRDGNIPKTLLKNAATAMLYAQQMGGNNLQVYAAESNVNLLKQLELESGLHTALQQNEFILHYQPIVDLRTGKICAAEALIRWKHPVYGFVPPDQFIPLAESNGVIIPLGEWVFNTACVQTQKWHEQGFNDLKIAINLSSKQLYKKDLLEFVAKVIDDVKLETHYIELELTESVAFQQNVIPVVKQFKSLGLRLSIDDFGTGYSGLSNLKLFDIDKLKIDKSFVRDIVKDNDSKAIVSNIISLAKKLEVEILAEGVETLEQLEYLQSQGCELVQGYYFSPPVDPEMFTEILNRKEKLL